MSDDVDAVLSGLVAEAIELIAAHEDPESRYLTARQAASHLVVGAVVPAITPWRRQLAGIMSQITEIALWAPDHQAATRRSADDLVYEIARRSRLEYGRTFDPIVDGPI